MGAAGMAQVPHVSREVAFAFDIGGVNSGPGVPVYWEAVSDMTAERQTLPDDAAPAATANSIDAAGISLTMVRLLFYTALALFISVVVLVLAVAWMTLVLMPGRKETPARPTGS